MEIATSMIFNTNFLKFIILHFYAFSKAIHFFLVFTYVLHNEANDRYYE